MTTTSTPAPSPQGSLIRMRALTLDQLPSHPSLATQQPSAPDLTTFITSALHEAQTFTKDYLPTNFAVKGTDKPSPPSTAGVKLYSHELKGPSSPQQETWFARVSVHDNEAKNGTASWEEFDAGLRTNHSQHEKDYTPNVFDAHEVLSWTEALEPLHRKIGQWEDVHVAVMEMAHQIPSPLNNRVFSVLVITARREKEFIVVQIPVDTNGLEGAKYRNAAKITAGMYCSIELGELVEEGRKVRWTMATASDAKGALPMWMQKMGVPGAVVKDVGFFIGWCEKRRKGAAV